MISATVVISWWLSTFFLLNGNTSSGQARTGSRDDGTVTPPHRSWTVHLLADRPDPQHIVGGRSQQRSWLACNVFQPRRPRITGILSCSSAIIALAFVVTIVNVRSTVPSGI